MAALRPIRAAPGSSWPRGHHNLRRALSHVTPHHTILIRFYTYELIRNVHEVQGLAPDPRAV
jgi:hypothetical protein